MSSRLWEKLISAAAHALFVAHIVVDLGRGRPTASPPAHGRAVLATLCKRERLLALLDAVTEVVVAADAASGAVWAYLCCVGVG